MPRTSGVSTTSTVWLRHLRPSPRTVARWSSRLAVSPLTSVTLSFFSTGTISSLRKLFDGEAALGRDVRRGVALLERVERRPYHVVGIRRPVTFRQDVGHADDLEYRAHRAAGDDPRASGCGLHRYPRRSVPAFDGMMQRAALKPHLDHPASGLFHRLLHRHRDFLRLPLAHANPAIAIAHDRKRREGENASALHDLRYAVDADHLLSQAIAPIILLLPVLLLPAHRFCHVRSRPLCGARTSGRPRGQRRPAPSRGRDT